MTVEVKVPILPESVSEATVAAWHKKVGDSVSIDENIVDIETEKVVLEVPSMVNGVIKEIRFGPQTDEHDYEFKKKHAIKFLQDGAKLKAFVFFKGRSIIFKEQGQILLLKLAQELEEYGKVEQLPKLEGKRMIMFIAPKKIK